MIAKWNLFNFKSVGVDTPLDFRRLTLFAGPNSSGKSSCIQSILLICQTLRNPIGSRSVILNGPLARLGQFSDLKTTGSAADQILIGWELQPIVSRGQGPDPFGLWEEEWVPNDFDDTDLTSVRCNVSFDAKSDAPNDTTQLNPQLFSTVIRANFRDADGVDHIVPFGISRTPDAGESSLERLRKIGAADEEIDRARSASAFRVELDEDASEDVRRRFASGEVMGCELIHFLPRVMSLTFNRAEDQAHLATQAIFSARMLMPPRRGRDSYIPPAGLRVLTRILTSAQGKLFEANPELQDILDSDRPVQLTVLMDAFRGIPPTRRRLVQELLQSDPKFSEEFAAAVRGDTKDDYRTAFLPPPRRVQTSCRYMRRYFSQAIKYLGPLRDEPKALYPLGNAADPFDIGLKGENTAAVLDLHKARLVRFVPPAVFSQPAVAPDAITRTLQAAVSEWLRYLRVAESVDSKDRGKLGHELKVTIDSRSGDQDLTHVGVGVSQVLPILVMCLLAEPDTVLMFEQPELHLHPRVQTLLGDFFLSMALMEKQCIIETHSEYLINRLRFRAAAATSADVADKMTIYFVEKREGRSHFRPIVVNEYGAIDDWPEGFFDQSQKEAEATLKAAMQKKRLAQSRKS
jgi:predicted ATPase